MKILLYTNILTPYRKYLYDMMAEQCRQKEIDFTVLVMADTENNRPWTYEQYAGDYTELLDGRTLSHGETYIHINPSLKRKLKEEKPDIVIASGSYLCPGTWTVAKLKKELGYKTLFWSESHQGEKRHFSGLKTKIREMLRMKFYRMFDAFLCPGELAMRLVRTYAGQSAKCILLPNLIDESMFSKNTKQHSPNDDSVTFFTPARLSPVKGILEFLDILRHCPSKGKITWMIAGDGELKKEIEEAAREYQVNVKLLGQRNQKEIIELYQNCDIFVLPSLSDPNPLSCVEALWVGKPMLVSDHVGNYPEVIEQGVNGYVFSFDEISSAVETVETIINSSAHWLRNATLKSKQIASEIYDSRRATMFTLEQMIQLVKEIEC